MRRERSSTSKQRSSVRCGPWPAKRQDCIGSKCPQNPRMSLLGQQISQRVSSGCTLAHGRWFQKAKGASPSANVVLGEYLEGFEFSLAPVWFNETDAVGIPFWHVSSSHDPSMANMVLKDTGKVGLDSSSTSSKLTSGSSKLTKGQRKASLLVILILLLLAGFSSESQNHLVSGCLD